MTPLQAYQITKIVWSYKNELLYLGAVMAVILMLPFFAIFTLFNTGDVQASDDLVKESQNGTGSPALYSPDGTFVSNFTTERQWPVRGTITATFGGRNHPYTFIHNGLDIANAYDTPITAFANGKVIATITMTTEYGTHVIIDHGNNILAIYGHMNRYSVSPGQVVSKGQIIGYMGSTGWSTGNHLHFQINSYGVPVDPMKFLP